MEFQNVYVRKNRIHRFLVRCSNRIYRIPPGDQRPQLSCFNAVIGAFEKCQQWMMAAQIFQVDLGRK